MSKDNWEELTLGPKEAFTDFMARVRFCLNELRTNGIPKVGKDLYFVLGLFEKIAP